ncbi:DUF3710 domain-containing protein [uncultured Corynebacterium sp.]|uniref:DUF3710 domain-containing protein n=1 Tax=uncultured Corynebacterium sp. TaxID=159447 RepID=UPI0025E1D17A|nr:DUF3710 domain-containing protein [uncultured Corynebacterium sp.]
MAMWPFGNKNNDDGADRESAEATVDRGTVVPAGDEREDGLQPVESGPFDVADAKPEEFDFSDFAKASVNLGSVLLAVPHSGDIQVEMGPQGPTMLHLVTTAGRITPVAFAAPTSGGLWETSAAEISEGLASDGLDVVTESGPWGDEIVGTRDDMRMRIIGADGPRWMMRLTLSGPVADSDELAEIGRGVMARCFVNRGDKPMPSGQPLPVTLPVQMAEQIRQAYAQQQNAQQQSGQPNTPQAGPGSGSAS